MREVDEEELYQIDADDADDLDEDPETIYRNYLMQGAKRWLEQVV